MPARRGRRGRTILVLLGVVPAAMGSLQAQANPTRPTGPPAHPFLIVENAGQFDHAVRFQVSTSQGILWLTDHSLWLTAFEPKPQTSRHQGPDPSAGPNARGPAAARNGVNLHLTFPGSRPEASLVAARPLPTRVNYFLGSDRSRWQSGVRTYGAVTRRSLYPGIAVTLEELQGGPALSIHADPGTDPGAFRLRVAGARDLRVSPDDRVVADTAIGPVTLPAIVHDGLLIRGTVLGSGVSFTGSLGSYAPPVLPVRSGPSAGKGLEYGTFLGGGDVEFAADLAVGQDGSTYVTGWTYSSDFPTTPGAFDTSLSGDRDAFISKLNPTGSALEYSTFLGGTGSDAAYALAVAPDGSASVAGATSSDDFPTTPGAYDTTYSGGDGFVTKLDPQGAGLVYSTFLGGTAGDAIEALALASDGTVYATGQTFSDDFPTTPGAFDSTYHGDGDGFVTALNPAGSNLVYSTFLGGLHVDEGHGIAPGPDGTAHVTGVTSSDDFPTTPGAYDTTRNGANDVFVTHVNADGSALVYSTYIGGNDDESAQAIALDEAGNAYVVGYTLSRNFPTTPGAYDTTFNGTCICSDAFATKLDATGSALVYSTFLGGKDNDSAQDLSLDPDGSLNVIGNTLSGDFPTTHSAFSRRRGGPGDAFVSRFDPTGRYLAYSSYLGGTINGSDDAEAGALAGAGKVSVAGATPSDDFPTTAGAYDRTFNGGDNDAYVATLMVAPTMHVGEIDPGYRPATPGYRVGARIVIVHADGSSVAGASVSVELDYPDGSKVNLTAKTGSNGVAVVGHHVTDSGTYTFTVLGVLGPPAVYDPSQNVETSDSVTIP